MPTKRATLLGTLMLAAPLLGGGCELPGTGAAWGGRCDPGYDERWHDEVGCEGNAVVTYTAACDQRYVSGRRDCASQGQICVELHAGYAECSTPCVGDDDCDPHSFCAPHGGSSGTCAPRATAGSLCTHTTHCDVGLACAPAPVTSDAGADADANADADAPHAMPTICQPDGS